MFLSSFNNTDEFNSLISSIVNNENVLPMDEHVYVAMSFKYYDILRSVLSTTNVDERATTIQNMFLTFEANNPSCASDDLERLIQTHIDAYRVSEYYQSGQYYIYPYSKQKFIEAYFSSLMPSFQSELYSYLTTTAPVFKQIGAGGGSAIIIKNFSTTSQSFIDSINSACSLTPKIKQVGSILSTIEKVMTNQSKDIDFLNKYIDDLEKALLHVTEELDKERKQGINGYHRTWH